MQTSSYLCASGMPQVIRPVDLESQMIIGMDHLMCHCVLQMSLIPHFICADQDTIFRIETTRFSIRTTTAINIVVMKVAT